MHRKLVLRPVFNNMSHRSFREPIVYKVDGSRIVSGKNDIKRFQDRKAGFVAIFVAG